MSRKIEIYGLTTIPEIKGGDDIARIIVEHATREGVGIKDGDVIVVSSKIVAKSEGNVTNIEEILPSEQALSLARVTGKDPRLVEVILRESNDVLKAVKGHLIVETVHGIVCANAGVDRSNVAGDDKIIITLPRDPDLSARKIRDEIHSLTGKRVAVVVTDTYGRPLRNGQVDMAIGLSGICPFRDYRGTQDLKGYTLRFKRIAIADEIASAAELVKGNGAEGVPVAIIRGLRYEVCNESSARELNMPREKWLFK